MCTIYVNKTFQTAGHYRVSP